MLSSKPKGPFPGYCATTPNATQSGVYHAEGSSTSLKKKARKTSKKQDKAEFRPIAAAIPSVDCNLHRLKDLRLEEQDNALYIPPQAKPSLQSSDDTLFPLLGNVFEFLAGPGLVFLLLGDSGGGKSTCNLQLERNLWRTYKRGGPFPLHVNLPSIDNPQQDIIGKQLRQLDFPDNQTMELKQNRQCILRLLWIR
ncbi:MAG: hypothetical protein J3R72DRAFT_223451 [Linnemannia gamsii]|nr:MAG: hypothetical protein J3R72DRAFT_223451 [Linnemannia gamsii]